VPASAAGSRRPLPQSVRGAAPRLGLAAQRRQGNGQLHASADDRHSVRRSGRSVHPNVHSSGDPVGQAGIRWALLSAGEIHRPIIPAMDNPLAAVSAEPVNGSSSNTARRDQVKRSSADLPDWTQPAPPAQHPDHRAEPHQPELRGLRSTGGGRIRTHQDDSFLERRAACSS